MARTGTAESFRVFVRNWWRRATPGDPGYPSALVPNPSARRHTIARHMTEAEARALCAEWNATHRPGPLSRKAEYERESR